MNTEKTSDLLNELERLKVLLDKNSAFEKTSENIPVLTDVIDGQTPAESGRQTVAVINLGEPGSINDNDNNDDSTTELRHQLRTEGRRMIRNLIDEELVRIESRLSKELNSHLEQLLDEIQPVSEPPTSPWEP
ncbi:hypothetical protein NX722_04620 [Endozoicomonas gorgoniicola]|uniref:Uncharacterized protein n=1 Tax=Endozoicomonas gorgoniicola TaxID=1234144 RepID=A0ABT3MRD9_9GAMM|nr:hypothetical protein [Endozoicomonas gorgoniicola]MCW7551933.1 hypothetical protein [Endozoicomonas gorgoniicola]